MFNSQGLRESYDCKNVRVLFINQKFENAKKKAKFENYGKNYRAGAEKDDATIKNLFEKTLKMKLEVENVLGRNE